MVNGNVDDSVSLKSIVEHFESLPDPRHTRNRRHWLGDVLVLSVCGVIVGCSGPAAIERWAKAKKDWLGKVLALPNGIPSRDCIRRILSALRPQAFQTCFQSWIAACLAHGDVDGEPTIAIDGKTMRRSHDAGCMTMTFDCHILPPRRSEPSASVSVCSGVLRQAR